MKERSARDHILLAQSGELGEGEAAALEHRLQACPADRAYRDDIERLTAVIHREQDQTEVSPLVVHRIRAEAERSLGGGRRRRPRRDASPWGLWRPAVVYGAAATLLLLLGVSYFRGQGLDRAEAPVPPPAKEILLSWDAELDAEIESLNEMLTLVYDETAANGPPPGEEDTLESIAAELLALEGHEI